jgi:hypothetical protein
MFDRPHVLAPGWVAGRFIFMLGVQVLYITVQVFETFLKNI